MDEYEDAAAVRDETWPVRAAVADGATESIFARAWDKTLVEGLCTTSATPEAFAEALPDWQASWTSNLADPTGDEPWYAVAKAKEGAFSTLLGLELVPNGRWRALGIGDSVLFHLHGTTFERAWPYSEPDDFSTRPSLVPSRSQETSLLREDCRTTGGKWQPGDTFLLATDAVAAWLLRGKEEGAAVSKGTSNLFPVQDWDLGAFRRAVTEARASGRLRNDDSTLLVLELLRPSADGPEDETGVAS